MEPKITSTKLLSTLSNQWLNFTEIVTIIKCQLKPKGYQKIRLSS